MSALAYRTSVAAQILSTTPHTLRRLAKAGLIDAEQTPTGHFRFPFEEVERLRKEGLPPIPQTAPGPDEPEEEQLSAIQAEMEPEPREDTPAVQEARETLKVVKTRVDIRKAELELEQTEDQFRERERQAARQRQADEQRKAEAQKASARKQWADDLLASTMRRLPGDCPPDAEESIASAARRILSEYSPDDPQSVVSRLLNAAAERELAPYRREKMIEQAVEKAVGQLPISVRGFNRPTVQQIEARRLARQAILSSGEATGQQEMEAIARHAVQPLVKACERAGNIKAIMDSLNWWELGQATIEERQEAQKAVKEELEASPRTATKNELEDLKERALKPHVKALKRRIEEEQAEALTNQLISAGLSHLSFVLCVSYEGDSETRAELRAELPDAIREAMEDEELGRSNINDFVAGWVEEQLAEEDDEED